MERWKTWKQVLNSPEGIPVYFERGWELIQSIRCLCVEKNDLVIIYVMKSSVASKLHNGEDAINPLKTKGLRSYCGRKLFMTK